MKILGLLAFFFFSLAEGATLSYSLTVTEKGFEPNPLLVKAGVPVVLKVTRKTNATCAREIVIPSQKIKIDLPLNKEVTIPVGKLAKGEIKFGCAMNMMIGGVMNVE